MKAKGLNNSEVQAWRVSHAGAERGQRTEKPCSGFGVLTK